MAAPAPPAVPDHRPLTAAGRLAGRHRGTFSAETIQRPTRRGRGRHDPLVVLAELAPTV
jgi:hypothetical protein